jgi:predicted MPP superfamily phosphohydrolase
MKIAIASDLHLEFGSIDLKNTENADLLILAGDIIVAKDKQNYSVYKEFFKQVRAEFVHVFYIMGNHEHYKGTIDRTKSIIEKEFDIKVYENEYFDLNGFRILGTTLWTDLNKADPVTAFTLKQYMTDYSVIRTLPEYTKLNPWYTYKLHQKAVKFIQDNLTDNTIVVTHHAPTHKSIAPYFVEDDKANGGYVSNLGDLILDNPSIKLWVHGHTHDNFDYEVGNSRVVCNPRGYVKYEDMSKYFQLKYIEIT